MPFSLVHKRINSQEWIKRNDGLFFLFVGLRSLVNDGM